MSLNWREINEVLCDLDLEGAFVQQVVQPGFDSIALYTYKEGRAKTVLIHLGANSCRIHETTRQVPKNEKPLRFMEFLKSRVRGCKMGACRQIGKERVVVIDLERGSPENGGSKGESKKNVESCRSGRPASYRLYLRLWSNAANLFLCDRDDTILDCFYRRPGKGEVNGNVFVPPSEPGGMSGEKEAAFVVRDFRELVDRGFVENEAALDSLSLSAKIDAWYGEYAQLQSREALLEQGEKLFTSRLTKMESALERLVQKREIFLHKEQWKHQGDLILSFAHLVDGCSAYLDCTDYDTGSPVRIGIDPQKSAQENAAFYYEQYKKASSGLADLERDISAAQKQLVLTRARWTALKAEVNPIKIEQLLRKQRAGAQGPEKKRPGLSFDVNGWTIFAGRNAKENDELLRRHVRGQDMWFHTRDVAGGFVFVKNRPGKTIPLNIMLLAGNLAVYFSKARQNAEADLYYTPVKYLRRAKNGPKGLVLPSHEKNLFLRLDTKVLQSVGL